MTQKSLKKISELFELHKSGALTKEEFENLKKQALSEDEAANVTNKNNDKFEKNNLPEKPLQGRKGNKVWMFTLIGIVLIVAAFFVLRTNNESVAKDQEGQNFKTVKIGKQIWMAENLNVATFRNGDRIFEANNSKDWEKCLYSKKAAWCYYKYDSNNSSIYGKFYNWFAINDPRGLSPEGWHVPSDSEWGILITYLGGENVAGGKLKETGIIHWQGTTTNATNKSGFTALPAGVVYVDGKFLGFGEEACFWSSNEDTKNIWSTILNNVDNRMIRQPFNNEDWLKNQGLSVRCVKTLPLSIASEIEYTINGKKIVADLLPPAGCYESRGNRINVIISNGDMTFQKTFSDGSQEENFNDFDYDVDNRLILVMGSQMWTLEYKGNGIIEETNNGATTDNPPVIYKLSTAN